MPDTKLGNVALAGVVCVLRESETGGFFFTPNKNLEAAQEWLRSLYHSESRKKAKRSVSNCELVSWILFGPIPFRDIGLQVGNYVN